MADVRDTEDLIRRHAYNLMLYAVDGVVEETKREANKDTGAMARDIYSDPIIQGSDIHTVTIHVPADYSQYVIYGTAPHVIRPKRRGGVLAWEGPRGTVFAKKVNHPGYRGNDFFFDPMLERWQRQLEIAIDTVVTQ